MNDKPKKKIAIIKLVALAIVPAILLASAAWSYLMAREAYYPSMYRQAEEYVGCPASDLASLLGEPAFKIPAGNEAFPIKGYPVPQDKFAYDEVYVYTGKMPLLFVYLDKSDHIVRVFISNS